MAPLYNGQPYKAPFDKQEIGSELTTNNDLGPNISENKKPVILLMASLYNGQPYKAPFDKQEKEMITQMSNYLEAYNNYNNNYNNKDK